MFQVISAFICIVLFLMIAYRKKNKANKKLPGPTGIPIFGNLFQVDYEKMHLMLHRLSLQYGDIFQFEIFGRKLVSLNSSEMIRNSFLHEPNATICAARPPTFIGKYANENYSDIAFASLDKSLMMRRKLFHIQVKAYGEGLVRIENEVNKNLKLMKTELISITGQPVCPKYMIEEFILNTVETLMIGRCYGRHGELQKLIRKLNDDGNTLGNPGTDVLYSLFPFLRFLPLQNSYLLKEFYKDKRQLMEMLSRIAKENTDYKGVYQGFMEEIKKTEGEEIHITEANVRSMLINLVSAAFVTTRGTLLSAVQILATRPELQNSLQTEVDKVIGREREPSLKDRENCPMIESFLLETLRYISHVPMSLLHYTSDSCEINGFHIDKGTIVIPNLWTAHHNDKEWKKPFDFLPERFLDESGQLLPATAYVRKSVQAFGSGKRSCIGEVFAKSRMFLFMATLMQTVTIKSSDDFSEFNLDNLKPGLVMEPLEYKVIFVQRK